MGTLNREQMVSDARALVAQGVNFRHLGRDPVTGLDCVHLPRYLCEKQGLTLPADLIKEMETYSENPDGWRMVEIMRRWFQEIAVANNVVPDAAIPSDLLVLYADRNPKHVAILSSKNPTTIIEAFRRSDKELGKLIEWPLHHVRRICAIFRIPDFA